MIKSLSDSSLTMKETKILSQSECLLISMLEFYSVPKRINTLVSVVKQKATISLRILDWFPTNYAKYNKVFINDKNVYLKYKDQLKAYSKKNFDPFCRRERIFLKFDVDSLSKVEKVNFEYFFLDKNEQNHYENREDGIITTVAQMNFFKWCIENNIIEYVFDNILDVGRDMVENISKRNKYKDKTRSTNGGITKTTMKIVVSF
jgi:hypothetical protein